MARTLEQITTKVYYLLEETSDSSVYSYDNVVVPGINTLQRQIARCEVMNELTGKPIKGGDLKFIRATSFIELVTPTKITSDVAIGDLTISFDTTLFSASGSVIINGDLISYTGKTTTTITGVTGISRTHKAGDEVRQAYTLSADLDRIGELMDEKNNMLVEAKDSRELAKKPRYYEEVNTSTPLQLDIVGMGDSILKLVYYKKVDDMINPTDVSVLPDDYADTALAHIYAGSLLLESGEAQQAQAILNKGYLALEAMYSSYAIKKKPHRRTIGVSSIITD